MTAGGQVMVGRCGSLVVYLAGTIHVDIPPPDRFHASCNLVRVLLRESDPLEQLASTEWHFPSPCRAVLGPHQSRWLRWNARILRLPAHLLLALPPFLAAAALVLGAVNERTPMDHALATSAQDAGVRVESLERLSDLSDLFDEIPLGVQLAYLERVLEAVSGGPPAWRQLRAAAISAWMQGGAWLGDLPDEIGHALLTARNRQWLPKVLEAAERGPVLVAVGAAHLAGPQSLTALLQQEGFRFESLGGTWACT